MSTCTNVESWSVARPTLGSTRHDGDEGIPDRMPLRYALMMWYVSDLLKNRDRNEEKKKKKKKKKRNLHLE
ncbi:hypothetical protein CSHISOI_08455 [Colletotrichum shisoi]|uniref:Uncharacterized protein n=1 Tax=Colletotrichum shisoi TaxID=2078593 RepID=A0A5Q4BJP8_9PEZI|nr:hypothetical protein CSHISOI_08455 [Colletotrichum shisoi]